MNDKTLLTAVQEAAKPGYAELTAQGLRQNRPDLVVALEQAHDISAQLTAARTEGVAAGKTEGAAAERSRIAAIQGAAFTGQEAMVASLIADGTSPGEAALKLNADYRAKGANLDAIKAGEKHVGGLTAAVVTEKPKTKTEAEMSEAELKTNYAGSDELKAEFPTESSYLGYVKGKNSGRLRILQRRDAA